MCCPRNNFQTVPSPLVAERLSAAHVAEDARSVPQARPRAVKMGLVRAPRAVKGSRHLCYEALSTLTSGGELVNRQHDMHM
ncbi:hypothetical protein PHYPSEUDO_003464 [Phytophthora pseudosyringae]|uniref:Uncharacterized protein n=1 Tax=Phytophthora pseudosyringae TaxID=221518 RepID=A0A8T1VUP0_9STRA|nr:hypothetical protein PHYPSEUDO_003464 [Phytophthora pseudosyringae]